MIAQRGDTVNKRNNAQCISVFFRIGSWFKGQDSVRQYRKSWPEPDKNFYYQMRHLTLTAYYTSEAGPSGELDFQVIPDHYEGRADARVGKDGRENQ